MGITGDMAQESIKPQTDTAASHPEEGRITVHRILEHYPRRGEGLSLLYGDLSASFDSNRITQ